jgi:hypothetical protein
MLFMRSLIYFTRELPGISEDLTERNIQVYEALALSEVFFLAEEHPGLIVVIDATIEEKAAHEVQTTLITLRLKPRATADDVIWELALLSGSAEQGSADLVQ